MCRELCHYGRRCKGRADQGHTGQLCGEVTLQVDYAGVQKPTSNSLRSDQGADVCIRHRCTPVCCLSNVFICSVQAILVTLQSLFEPKTFGFLQWYNDKPTIEANSTGEIVSTLFTDAETGFAE